ncbi:hypothetical protein KVT40_001290 [Elsinoe batatas]|uniref:Uncharacterized protein n=1 Tax=Elsinoe batatas TaxID=2601811 RepID=A0A8K0LB93_9PEZI|nr:hypothetical protein KVT40_001290 [Elsinoe batatas]
MDPNAFTMNGVMPQAQMQMNHMQRPQPGNNNEQIFAKILEQVSQNSANITGWQATLDPRERAAKIMELVTCLRHLNNEIWQCVTTALKFENQTLLSAHNKEMWQASLANKIGEINTVRAQKANTQMMAMNNQGQQPGFFPQTPMQQSRSHQGEMPNGFTPQMPNMGGQMGMPMQASPMNMMGQQNPMANMNQQDMQQQQQQQQQQQRQNNNRPGNLSQEEHMAVVEMARQMMAQVPLDQQKAMREKVINSMGPQQNKGGDPLQRHFYQMAMKKHVHNKARQGQPGQQNPNMQGMQRPNQPQMLQQQPGQQSNGEVDFSALIGQQADAMKMQGAGELVVPASNNMNGMNNNNNNHGMGGNQQGNMGGMQIPPNMSQMQFQQLLQQRQAQQQQQQQLRNNQIQAQAQAQAQAQIRNAAQNMTPQQMQLRGQGLNVNQPPQRSPAMSMLNRPMVPPGQQQNQNTPQQTPAQPQQQQQQNMAAPPQQANMGGNQFNQQRQNIQIPTDMPIQLQQRLATMPEERLRPIIMQWHQRQAGMKQQQQPQQQQAPQQQQQANQQGGMQAQQGQQSNMPPQGMQNNQHQAQPNMNGQQPNGPAAVTDQQRMMANQNRVRMYDQRRMPPSIIQNLRLPESISTWGQAKQIIMNNPQSMANGNLQKLQKMQQVVMQREEEVMRAKQNQAQGQSQGQAPNQGQQQPPSTAATAPQAMMTNMTAQPQPQMPQPPQAQNMQAQVNAGMPTMANLPMPQPTPQEIQMLRQKMPNLSGLTDEQTRQVLMQMKLKQLQQKNPALLQQQNEANAARNMQQQQPQQPQMEMPPQMQQQMPGQPQMPQGQMPGMQMPQMGQPPQQQMQQGMPQQGNQNRPMQRPPTQQLTPQQIAGLHPEQRKAYEFQMQQRNALMNAQQPQGPAPNQRPPGPTTPNNVNLQQVYVKVQGIMQELQMTMQKGMPIDFAGNTQMLTQAIALLKETYGMFQRIDQNNMWGMAMMSCGEDGVRKLLVMRHQVYQQLQKDGQVNGYISLPLQDIMRMHGAAKSFFNTMRQKFAEMQQQKNQAQKAAQGSAQQQQQQQKQPQASPQQVPAAAEMQRQPTQNNNAPRTASQNQNRKNSTAKPPSAPTTEHPPQGFDARSPPGVPQYAPGRPNFAPEKLQIPASKKRKSNAAGTPTQTNAESPQVIQSKTASPEQKRQAAPKSEGPKEPERKFKCQDNFCEFSIKGFENQEQLAKHFQTAHQKPAGDPFDFFMTTLDEAAKLDNEKEKAAKAAAVAAAKPKPSASTPVPGKAQPLGQATMKKEALKAEGKKEIATPASTAAAASPASPNKLKKQTPQATPGKTVAPVVDSPQKPKTMREHLEQKYGLTDDTAPAPKAAEKKVEPATVTGAEEDFLFTFGQAIDDLDPFAFDSVTGNLKSMEFDYGDEVPKTPEVPELTPDGSDTSQGTDDNNASREMTDEEFWRFLSFGKADNAQDVGFTNGINWDDFTGDGAKVDGGKKRAWEVMEEALEGAQVEGMVF